MSAVGRVPVTPTRRLEQIGWAVVGAACAYSGDPQISSTAGLVLAVATALLGARVFWLSGGHRITAAGLWSLATAIFGGFAGIYWNRTPTPYDALMVTPLLASYVSLVAMWALFWSDPLDHPRGPQVASWFAPAASAVVGVVMVLLSTFLYLSEVKIGATVVQEIAFVGLMLVSIVLVLSNASARTHWFRLAMGVGVVLVFAQTVFTGYGRLIIVSLGLVPVIVASWRARTRMLKLAMLIAVGPALVVFVRIREAFGQQEYGSQLSGIGSVVTPLRDFGRLVSLHANDGFPLAQGHTFVAALTVPVPRAIWPGKPIGFGAELTDLLEPQLRVVEQSMAALAPGEWFFDFGWSGVALMVLVVGWLIRRLDDFAARATTLSIDGPRSHLHVVVAALLTCDIPNLFWVGTFGYTSRTFIRLGVVMMVIAVVAMLPRTKPAPVRSRGARRPVSAGGVRRAGPRRAGRPRAHR